MKTEFWEEEQLIRNIGNDLIKQFQENGVTPGVNGPYQDQETIVRNLAHLIVITSIEIINFNREELRPILLDMADQLLGEEVDKGKYQLRNKINKDQTNGVIGHAWVMEAYLYLYKVFKDDKYINKAIEIYNHHEFNIDLGLWKRPSSETMGAAIDYTLNHQLWFAGISAEILSFIEQPQIKKDFEVFFSRLNKNITIDSNGLICHSLIKKESVKSTSKAILKRGLDLINRRFGRPSYYYKEVGYHIFNIAAFARLYQVFPENCFWKSSKFNKILEYTNSNSLLNGIQYSNDQLDISLKNTISEASEKEINIYAFPYNVPGFEMYYIKKVFGDRITPIYREYMAKQMEFTFDKKEKKFTKRCFDKVTINYRIYEFYKALEVSDKHQ